MESMRYVQSLVPVFFAVLSVHAGQQPRCPEIAGTERLWSQPGLRFVVVGEMHGTTETPAIFADLVCSARITQRPIVVGVELRDQDAIDAFMGSDGSGNREVATHELLSKREGRSSDGRTSQAMLMLLEELRALKLQGIVSGVVAFSHARPDAPDAEREERMASVLLSAAKRNPNALVIALTGNVHASKKTLPEIGSYPLMASFLPSAETVSLFVTDRGGEAWTCDGTGCGPHSFASTGALNRGITLSQSASPLPGFDGVLSTGLKATASSPAIQK
jgi:hypothetical protein